MFLPYDRSPRNTPPPVQALEERDMPNSPVLMLPSSAQGSPPNECLALTWHNDNQNKPGSLSTSPTTRDIVLPNGQSPDSSVYRQSRALVFYSPSGQKTVCLQETRCYSLPSDETQSTSSRRGSPSPSKYKSFADTRGGGVGSERKAATLSPRGGLGRDQNVSLVTQTSPEMRIQNSRGKYTPDKLHSGTPGSTEIADPGSLDPTVRNRGQRKTRKDGKPGRNLSKADRYSGILEQDHPEETLSRGILGTCCCFLTCIIVLFLLAITILVWCSKSPSGCLVPFFSTSEKCQKINISHVKNELQRNLVGQPVAMNFILDTLDASGESGSNKPLIMFFHGSSGVGKSFTADILAESISSNTKKEPCINLLSVDLFLRSETTQSKEIYMKILQDWVNRPMQEDKRCCISFFIFDELRDDIPQDLIQTLGQTLSQLDTQDSPAQSQHLKVIIIMTLIGSQSISDFLVVNMKRGQDRQSLTLPHPNWQEPWKHLVASLDKQDPFWTWLPPGAFIRIPFLPLERSHIKECAKQSLSRNNLTITEERLEWVADQMTYIPEDWPMFSVSGCKKVSSKVGLIHKEKTKPLFEFKKSF
ncbi:torsin-4A-like [Asterias rubens]|uniref:torsin-4A-like n=1 Tax=Asterias rubens TaxID=7604 RepID=UPI00145517D9|nr:torsin-4A-like [Asterias rubens]XP_033643266.1 torsin-4A-like [Asterias rubens]